MFIENKYTKKYWELINHRKINVPDGYTEKHHIIPRSLGGTDEEDNIVKLTAREHFFAHRLLSKMTEGEANIKMMWAVHRMLHSRNYYYSSRTYEILRKQHILFLKENHHSRRIEGWNELMSEQVTAVWQNNETRRRQQSIRMKETMSRWKPKDPEAWRAELARRSKLGTKARIEKHATRVEYNGKVYKGWREFTEQTGISKHLYDKFYRHGIDPSFRIGKDGPMTKEDIDVTIGYFCRAVNEPVPVLPEEYYALMARMRDTGLITDKQISGYFKVDNWK